MARKQRIGEILVAAGLIDEAQLRRALSDQQRWGDPLGTTLVKRGFLTGEDLVLALAAQLGTPVVRLRGRRIATEVLELLPGRLAAKYGCIPLFTKREAGAEVLYLGMEDPTDVGALDDLTLHTGMKLRPMVVSVTELREAIRIHYEGGNAGASQAASDFRRTLLDDTAPIVPDLELEPPVLASPPPGRRNAAPEAVLVERPREVPTRTILRAITQILIDKDVVSREELVERIQALAAADSEPDSASSCDPERSDE